MDCLPWYVGIVDVLTPFPTPMTTRPTIICTRGVAPGKAVTWMMTPRSMMAAPRMMARRRPSRSPAARMNMAPMRQPIS